MTNERQMTESEHEALETVAFDPTQTHLDLTKDEKLRTTALMLAIKYVSDTICKDVDMYRELRNNGKELIPATVPFVLQSAVQFEAFLLGQYSTPPEIEDGRNTEEDRPEPGVA